MAPWGAATVGWPQWRQDAVDTSTFGAALAAIAAFGVTGSLHCAAMCGPLAAGACGAGAAPGAAPGTARRMLVYHGTRLVAYTTLGSVAGLSSAVILRSTLQAFAP